VVYHIAWTHYLFLVCAAAVMAIVGWQTYTFNGTCVPIPCHIYGAGSAVVAVLVLAVMLPAACCTQLEVDADGFRKSDCCSTASTVWGDVASIRVGKFRSRLYWPLCCFRWSREVITIDLVAAKSKQKNEHGVDIMLEHFSFRMPVTVFVAKLNRMREAAISHGRSQHHCRPVSTATYEPPILLATPAQARQSATTPLLGAYRAIGPLNVRVEPSVRAAKRRTLAAGEQVTLTQIFTDRGNQWGQLGEGSWAMVSNVKGAHFLQPLVQGYD
jgi:hypothetical protein